jgi:uncharacterized protein YuzE
MKIRFDAAADALYIRLDEAAVDSTVEAMPGLDLDGSGRVVGIEMLAVRSRLPAADFIKVEFDAA